jgi:hypothetical protein
VGGAVFAAANHRVYGSIFQRSTDGLGSWKRSKQIGRLRTSRLASAGAVR